MRESRAETERKGAGEDERKEKVRALAEEEEERTEMYRRVRALEEEEQRAAAEGHEAVEKTYMEQGEFGEDEEMGGEGKSSQ